MSSPGPVPDPRGERERGQGAPGARVLRRLARRAVLLAGRRLARHPPGGLVPQDRPSAGAAAQ